MTARVARASARGRRDEAGAGAGVAAAGAVAAGVETVGECVMGAGVRVPPLGAAPAGVSEGHFFAASKASAMELKISV